MLILSAVTQMFTAENLVLLISHSQQKYVELIHSVRQQTYACMKPLSDQQLDYYCADTVRS